jgi:hypothetical protein
LALPGYNDKQYKEIAKSMRPDVGWNVNVSVENEAPDHIKERFINLMAKDIRELPEVKHGA